MTPLVNVSMKKSVKLKKRNFAVVRWNNAAARLNDKLKKSVKLRVKLKNNAERLLKSNASVKLKLMLDAKLKLVLDALKVFAARHLKTLTDCYTPSPVDAQCHLHLQRMTP
jgi:hypothetical protein